MNSRAQGLGADGRSEATGRPAAIASTSWRIDALAIVQDVEPRKSAVREAVANRRELAAIFIRRLNRVDRDGMAGIGGRDLRPRTPGKTVRATFRNRCRRTNRVWQRSLSAFNPPRSKSGRHLPACPVPADPDDRAIPGRIRLGAEAELSKLVEASGLKTKREWESLRSSTRGTGRFRAGPDSGRVDHGPS